jgi:DNA mismatch endonuclease (patch repair protein)
VDVLTKEQRSKNMRAIKSSGTHEEILLSKKLWKKGYRYRKNNKSIFGKPDLTFSGRKLAVFIDSEYFHGKDWDIEKYRIKTNRDFWWKKIESNMKRDVRVNQELSKSGWKVLRFWSTEIRNNLANCISKIEENLR